MNAPEEAVAAELAGIRAELAALREAVKDMHLEKWVPFKQAARIYDVSERSIENWAKEGKVKAGWWGGKRVVLLTPRDEVPKT